MNTLLLRPSPLFSLIFFYVISLFFLFFFFFNDTATTEIYTLSLHDALPISNALRDYFRDIGRMVLAAEGRKANDSHADCYQYFCVPEYGTANGRLHFHAVHFMRTLPTGSVATLGRDRKSGSAGMPRPISYAV